MCRVASSSATSLWDRPESGRALEVGALEGPVISRRHYTHNTGTGHAMTAITGDGTDTGAGSAPSVAVGWLAVVAACLSFGSFAVPMKLPSVVAVKVHPLVFQTYKTAMVLLTCWVSLLWAPFEVTPWGLVSGLSWVPAGVAAVASVQAVGLGTGQGVWSSVIVLVSFVWGAFVFNEPLVSVPLSCLAVVMLMAGVAGMAYYTGAATEAAAAVDGVGKGAIALGGTMYVELAVASATGDEGDAGKASPLPTVGAGVHATGIAVDGLNDSDGAGRHSGDEDDDVPLHQRNRRDRGDAPAPGDLRGSVPERLGSGGGGGGDIGGRGAGGGASGGVWACGMSRRTFGLAAAVFNGVWGGSNMVPLKVVQQLAQDDAADAGSASSGGDGDDGPPAGIGYVVSFALGSAAVNVALWVGMAIVQLGIRKQPLPPLHLSVMALPGSLAGILWSIGNFCSMVSVLALGEAIGYSSVQASILVSGLWSMFYYRETSPRYRVHWFGSAVLATAGIVLLSQMLG